MQLHNMIILPVSITMSVRFLESQMKIFPYMDTYRIAGFFKGENFHEFHESIAIRENFTLEIFTKSIRHCVLLTSFVKISPSKSWITAIRENFPPRENLLYGTYVCVLFLTIVFGKL